jgi:hypothetical protein
MPVEYELSREIQEALDEMLWNTDYTEFEDLRTNEVAVAGAIKVKMNEADMEIQPIPGPAVKLVKLNDVARLFTDKHYVVVVDAYFWQHSSRNERLVGLHRALMQIQVDRQDDVVKLKTRRPDVQEFSATLIRFGPTPAMQRLVQVFQSASREVTGIVSSTH